MRYVKKDWRFYNTSCKSLFSNFHNVRDKFETKQWKKFVFRKIQNISNNSRRREGCESLTEITCGIHKLNKKYTLHLKQRRFSSCIIGSVNFENILIENITFSYQSFRKESPIENKIKYVKKIQEKYADILQILLSFILMAFIKWRNIYRVYHNLF